MPKLTIYITDELSIELRKHAKLNKSRVASQAIAREILSGKCSCPACRKRREEARKARSLTMKAIQSGTLAPRPCEVCESGAVQAHHDDYNSPLSVRWLCAKHHRAEHVEMSGARQATYRADAEDIEDQMRDMRELYSCMHCKHTWIPRKEIVRICPKCKRMLS